VLVDRPDRAGRVQILRVHVRSAAAGRRWTSSRWPRSRRASPAPTWPTSCNEAALAGHAPRRAGGGAGGLHRRGGAHRGRPREAQPRAAARASARSSRTTRWATPWWR
jgi:hypothetical protein